MKPRYPHQTIDGKLYEYRKDSMYYDGEVKYHIERRIDGGKWKLLFGNLTLEESSKFLENPESIEYEMRVFKRTRNAIILVIVWFIIYQLFLK